MPPLGCGIIDGGNFICSSTKETLCAKIINVYDFKKLLPATDMNSFAIYIGN
jgi:hypothetical protein